MEKATKNENEVEIMRIDVVINKSFEIMKVLNKHKCLLNYFSRESIGFYRKGVGYSFYVRNLEIGLEWKPGNRSTADKHPENTQEIEKIKEEIRKIFEEEEEC